MKPYDKVVRLAVEGDAEKRHLVAGSAVRAGNVLADLCNGVAGNRLAGALARSLTLGGVRVRVGQPLELRGASPFQQSRPLW